MSLLTNIYRPNLLIRFIADGPKRAGFLCLFLGFLSLCITNFINGSLLWSSPRIFDVRFGSTPFDWLYLFFLLPGAFWALGHYYNSISKAFISLEEEGILNRSLLEETVEKWNSEKILRYFIGSLRYLFTILYSFLIYKAFPSWCSPDKSIWYMNSDRSPNWLGYQYMALAILLSLIFFDFLFYVFKITRFHFLYLNKNIREKEYREIPFIPQHPDGAFGYGLLSSSMNWAGILGLFVLITFLVLVIPILSTAMTLGKLELDPALQINLLIFFILFPWIMIGPLYPFFKMLAYRKNKFLIDVRQAMAKKLLNSSISKKDIDALREKWEMVANGRPFIIERKAFFFYASALIFSQITQIASLILKMSQFNAAI